jgi:hypothetical protein
MTTRTMPHVDLDPQIMAFNIVSDRLDSLEISTELILNGLRRQELREEGDLNSKLWDLPFPVRRTPGPHNHQRHNNGMRCAVIEVYETCTPESAPSHYECICHKNNPDLSMFSPQEIKSINETNRVGCLFCHMIGLESMHYTVCEESLNKKIKQQVNPTFCSARMLPPIDSTRAFALVSDVNSENNLIDFVREAARLFCIIGHETSCISSVVVHECDVLELRLHRLGEKWRLASSQEAKQKLEKEAHYIYEHQPEHASPYIKLHRSIYKGLLEFENLP